MKSSISLCMIVKNESKLLRRCLESVVGLIDEIIIVDTGSTDDTKEISREFTENVYEYKWNENFSNARNYAASKATSDWILVLDADEYIYRNHLIEVKQFINESKELFDIFAVNIINFVGENGENVIQHKHVRFYKNNREIEFFRSVHEQLRYKDVTKEVKIGTLPILTIFHSGYLGEVVKEKNKNVRNQILIEQELKRVNNGFDMYNLGNELRSLGKNQEALDIYIKAYQTKGKVSEEWVARCTISIIECLISLSRYEEALEVVKDAKNLYINSPDFLYLEGLIHFYEKNYNEAKMIFHYILSNHNLMNNIIKSLDYKDFIPNLKLGEIYEIEKDYSNAIKFYINALNYNKYSLEVISSVLRILSIFHTAKEIRDFLIKNILPHNNPLFCKKVIAVAFNLGLKELSNLLIDYYLVEKETS
ncbi:glycosyltransferase [Bacillus tianshenii]|uniref:tetratricopeptide repeat-containing glycosyltransferase family 2 protein n=1 Tax=Sutcliffiella tianshenii TaxID=1463404 RepID=UPI001CD75340|nr:glycosyltransferase family 2 protein [Bacillus tianshenii]MCA1320519.1 glycosyltransferase [Bacillus tianshenii]